MAVAMEFCTAPMTNSSVDFLVSNKRMVSRSSSKVGFGSFGLGIQSKGVVVLRRNLVRCEAVEETNRSVGASSSSSSSISILEKLKASGADRYTREKSSLVVIGLSVHTAPVEMREKLSIPEAQWFQAIEDLCDLNHIEEAAVLSTCNRMEIYFVALSWHRGIREVTEWMSKISGVPVSELRNHLFLLRDNDATHHLFEVSAGLDSLVLGEGQILSQVKQVIRIGQANGGLGKNIDRLFKDAITAGKRVRSETSISSGAVSVSSAAVELALTKLPATHRSSARMLVVGAGKMGKLVIKHLVAKGCNKVVVMNRSLASVSSIQDEFNNVNIIYKPFSEMLSCAAEADVIFTCTASETALFLKDHVVALPPPNPEIGGTRIFIDISVPRNVSFCVSDVQTAQVFNVDDLKEVVAANKEDRLRKAMEAQTIISEELKRFQTWRDSLQTVPTIKKLRAYADRIKCAELVKCLDKIGDEALTKKTRKAVEEMSNGIINKLLHGPLQHLRCDDDDETIENMSALNRMFDLDTEKEILKEKIKAKVEKVKKN